MLIFGFIMTIAGGIIFGFIALWWANIVTGLIAICGVLSIFLFVIHLVSMAEDTRYGWSVAEYKIIVIIFIILICISIFKFMHFKFDIEHLVLFFLICTNAWEIIYFYKELQCSIIRQIMRERIRLNRSVTMTNKGEK